jgi:hypothetical protein
MTQYDDLLLDQTRRKTDLEPSAEWLCNKSVNLYGIEFHCARHNNQGGEHSVEKISEHSIGRLKNLWKHKHSEEKPA